MAGENQIGFNLLQTKHGILLFQLAHTNTHIFIYIDLYNFEHFTLIYKILKTPVLSSSLVTFKFESSCIFK